MRDIPGLTSLRQQRNRYSIALGRGLARHKNITFIISTPNYLDWCTRTVGVIDFAIIGAGLSYLNLSLLYGRAPLSSRYRSSDRPFPLLFLSLSYLSLDPSRIMGLGLLDRRLAGDSCSALLCFCNSFLSKTIPCPDVRALSASPRYCLLLSRLSIPPKPPDLEDRFELAESRQLSDNFETLWEKST